MAESGLPTDNSDILAFYEKYDEEGRLARGGGHLEIARMQELIERFLPSPPNVVLDVGGGPAVTHAGWPKRATKYISSTPSRSTSSRPSQLPSRSRFVLWEARSKVMLGRLTTAMSVQMPCF